ncbi:hypothetical protein Droror1_Dr00025826 [Drosera rotundifolia]
MQNKTNKNEMSGVVDHASMQNETNKKPRTIKLFGALIEVPDSMEDMSDGGITNVDHASGITHANSCTAATDIASLNCGMTGEGCTHDEDIIGIPANADIGKNKKKRAQLPSKEEINKEKVVPPPLPMEVKAKIHEKGGTDIMLVMQKYIFDTDVKTSEGRLSIPDVEFRHDKDSFLKDEEKAMLNHPKDAEGKKQGISVLVFDLSLIEWTLELKRWKCYVLVKQWNKLFNANEIQSGDLVQLWSFRYGEGKLGFAMVKLNK